MENRKEKRVAGQTAIRLIEGDQSFEAEILDVSKKGISIKCEHVFPTYRIVNIIMDIGSKSLEMKGSVRWVNEKLKKGELNEIGILLLDPPEDFLNYVDILQ
ncbi:MAG: PilZ domain-containing protein [Candidatus Aminicenantes bacterium]|nr:PilZ domain-containing protein [Candidatus Aminicenantes bacterium]